MFYSKLDLVKSVRISSLRRKSGKSYSSFKVFLIFGTFYIFKKFKLKNGAYTNTVL